MRDEPGAEHEICAPRVEAIDLGGRCAHDRLGSFNALLKEELGPREIVDARRHPRGDACRAAADAGTADAGTVDDGNDILLLLAESERRAGSSIVKRAPTDGAVAAAAGRLA
jgi:hypothetical protein